MSTDAERTIDRWKRLLALEMEAARAPFEEAGRRLDLRGREAAGLAVSGLVVQDTGAGALGRSAWVLAPRTGELPPVVSAGDPVRLYRRRTPETSIRALVSRRTRRTITLVMDEPPDEAWESAELVLERLWDDRSQPRLLAGLDALLRGGGAAARWRSLLLEGGAVSRGALLPLEDATVNDRQREAAARAIACASVGLVHGPPGTGKTHVLAAIAVDELRRGGTVLACAASHAAVDNLVVRLAARGLEPVRLGHPARVHADVVDHTLEARTERHEKATIARALEQEARELLRRADRAIRQGRSGDRHAEAREARTQARALRSEARRLADQAESEVLSGARVVCATLTGLERLRGRLFSRLLVDEATQATWPATVPGLLLAESAVLAGDPHQLPPTVLSSEAARGGLATSLYEALLAQHGDGISTMLEVQHRMHREIMAYPGEALYAGRLVAHPSVEQHTLPGLAPLLFVDSAGKGWSDEQPEGSASHCNPGEAQRVAAEVQSLLAAGIAPHDIGVTTPYAAQVQLLRSLLPDEALEIDSIDAFQGREKEAMLVSLVRSNDDGALGFCADVRRINVALTRARKRLFVVGDSATLASHPFHTGWVRHVESMGRYVSAWEE